MIKVSDNLWRGARPKTCADLKALGVTRVIDLETGFFEATHDDLYEREDKASFGITMLNLPCSDIFPPASAKVSTFLTRMMDPDQKTYVHCYSGLDRTGFMCAVYRMRKQRWSFEEAHAEWVELGRHWWFWWWKWELKRWAK